VILIRSDAWYDRDGIYRDAEYVEFPDAVARAAFFGRCVAEWVRRSGRGFDLVHGNDWQSGAALAHLRAADPAGRTTYLMNVHNAEYVGAIAPAELAGLGLPEAAADSLRRRSDGRPSLLLLGLLCADAAVASSPTYARELVETFRGHPIGGALRGIDVSGIVSGVDRSVWDPASLGPPAFAYGADTAAAGKPRNKLLVQRRLGLRTDEDVALFGVCSRLVEEKGTDILAASLEGPVARGECQLVVVGPGEGSYRDAVRSLAAAHQDAVYHLPRFDQRLAWQVYAAADFTPMPSRVEPCGLNQLIAMAYGTIPIVTAVGGLRDTVVDLRRHPDHGTGFVAAEATVASFGETVRQAIAWRGTRREEVVAVRRRCMLADWSWRRTASEFAALYRAMAGRIHAGRAPSPR
jgi:starch synthase